jgi:hypothetical protein
MYTYIYLCVYANKVAKIGAVYHLVPVYKTLSLSDTMESAAVGVNLCVAIASHVTTQRLPMVQELIEAIHLQTYAVPIYFAWSCDNQITQRIVEQLLDCARKRYSAELVSIFSDDQCTQFQHYHRLVSRNPLPSGAWLAFSDDDDMWNTKRWQHCVEFIQGAIDQSSETHLQFQCIKVNNFGRFSGPVACIPDAECITHDVQQFGEYWQYLATVECVTSFFGQYANTQPQVLASPFCDVRFVHFMRTFEPSTHITVCITSPEPLYLYRIHSHSACGQIETETARHRWLQDPDFAKLLQQPKLSASINVLTSLDVRNTSSNSMVSIICSTVEFFLLKNPGDQSFSNFIEFRKPSEYNPEFELHHRQVSKAAYNIFAGSLV